MRSKILTAEVAVCYNKKQRTYDRGKRTMRRYHILDGIRGITLCSMILYHAVWDLVYLFGYDWNWYRSDFAYLWQQSICWCFILLSGFCFSLGKKKWRRGVIVFCAGALVSLVTHIAMPGQSVRFGVLTMLGSSMLLMAFWEYIMKRFWGNAEWNPQNPSVGLGISFAAFFLTRGINERYLGFEGIRLFELPTGLYHKGDLMTYIGFMSRDFYSTDYFSIMPWFFLFSTGYFLYHWMKKKEWLSKLFALPGMGRPFQFMGKHSLIIYMLHQPVVFVFLTIWEKLLLRV